MDRTCVLKLYKLYFDKIEFIRKGGKNDNTPQFSLSTVVTESTDGELYKVEVKLSGEKEQEYTTEIIIIGIFSVSSENGISSEVKKSLITMNAVAILLPYLRSEMSLLTAQPETDSVVLPPINVKALIENANEKNEQ